MTEADIRKAIQFVRQNTHIECREDLSVTEADPYSMWKEVSVRGGKLFVNPELAHPGDLLHDAGHLALMPELLRSAAWGEFAESDNGDNYSEILANCLNAGILVDNDSAATYWAFLACREIGIEGWLAFENGFGRREGAEIYQRCLLGIGSQLGSFESVQAYYRGFIPSKGSDRALWWDCTTAVIATKFTR